MLIDDLTLFKPIGRGAFAEVYLSVKNNSKVKLATKRINKRLSNPKYEKYLINVIRILKELDHPNLIKLFEVKETANYLYLVTEYCNGGDLEYQFDEYLEKYDNPFKEEVVQHLMKQIVLGLQYLHKKKVILWNLKLDNIFLYFDSEKERKDKNMIKVKIKLNCPISARYLSETKLYFFNDQTHIDYLKNKILNNKNLNCDCNEKYDIWNLGIICYKLLVGKSIFEISSFEDLLKKTIKGDYYLPKTLSKEAISFLNNTLQYDPNKRLSAEELLNHDFLRKPYSEFTKINLKEIRNIIVHDKIKINIKDNQNISDIFNIKK